MHTNLLFRLPERNRHLEDKDINRFLVGYFIFANKLGNLKKQFYFGSGIDNMQRWMVGRYINFKEVVWSNRGSILRFM
jgi:hypothetical protein